MSVLEWHEAIKKLGNQSRLKEAQISVLAACLDSQCFERVKWLEIADFDPEFKQIWKALQVSDGKMAVKLSYQHGFLLEVAKVSDYHFPEQIGLFILENRFREYFEKIMIDLFTKPENASCSMLIKESLDESKRLDIFEVIEMTPQYIGTFANVKRLEDLNKYVNTRIKSIQHEFRTVHKKTQRESPKPSPTSTDLPF